MKDLTVTLDNRPGRLADLGEATGRAGFNIEGYAAPPKAARASSTSWWRTPAATRAALSEAGIEVSGERDVLVVVIEDRPGTMGEVARRIGEAV